MSDFSDLGVAGKLVLPEVNLDPRDVISRTEVVGIFLMPRGRFLI